MDMFLSAFLSGFTPSVLLFVAAGVAVGIVVGAIPGLGGGMAIAIATPLTFTMPPVMAIGFLLGIMKGANYGGSLSSVLLNTPGDAAAVATTFDGYPMAQQGRGMKAIKMSLFASVFGDIATTLLLIMVAGPIAGVALKLGPSEMGALVIFALTIIAALESASLCKGILAAALGMLISTVGLDPVGGNPRLTLGIYQLEGGIRLIAMAIGTMAMAELIIQSEKKPDPECGNAAAMVSFSDRPEDRDLSFGEFIRHWKTLLRSTGIGAGIGALPGIGAAVAGFLAYGTAKSASDDPDSYGKGNIDGVAAPESANSAVVSASLIPLLTLGIPGSVMAAMLIGAFMIQGVTPGPLMYENQPEMIYGIYGTLISGNLLLLVIGLFSIRYITRVLCVPAVYLMPCIMFVCMLGAYMETGTVFPVVSMGALAIFGYFLKKLRFSFVCVIVGFILGPLLELYVQQVVIGADGDWLSVISRPGTAAIVSFNALFLIWTAVRGRRKRAAKAPA